MSASHVGPRGSAVELPIDPEIPNAATTVTWWLLTGSWHPLWSQFVLTVVSLADLPGAPAAHVQFPGATHELLVVALNPGQPPVQHTPETLTSNGLKVGWLEPVDVIHQFTATDEEMRQIANLCARACVDGALTPSTDDARALLREHWLQAVVKTLAHMRGEEHAP